MIVRPEGGFKTAPVRRQDGRGSPPAPAGAGGRGGAGFGLSSPTVTSEAYEK
jgi:hypothetical protein